MLGRQEAAVDQPEGRNRSWGRGDSGRRELRATRQVDARSTLRAVGKARSRGDQQAACIPTPAPGHSHPTWMDKSMSIKLFPGPMASPRLGFVMTALHSV